MTFAGLLQSGMIQETIDAAALRYDLHETLPVFRSGCDWINEQGIGLLLPVDRQRMSGRDRLVFDLSGCQALTLWMRKQSNRGIQAMLAAVAGGLNELIAGAYLNVSLIAPDLQHIYVSEYDGRPRLLCLPLCLPPVPDGDPMMPLSLFEAAVSERGFRAFHKAATDVRPPAWASGLHFKVAAESPAGRDCPTDPAAGDAETVARTQRLPQLADAAGESPLMLESQDGSSLLIPGGLPYRIGQAPACEGRLSGYPAVSRHHCTLLAADGRVLIRDDHSLNGTFVNGVRLRPGCPEPLAPGDRVRLADVVYRVKPIGDWRDGCLPQC